DRIGLVIDSQPLGHCGCKPLALQNGIGQFTKTIGKLDTASIKLKALRKARIVLESRERRFGCRIIHQNRRATVAQLRLDLCYHDFAKNIPPAVVGYDSDPVLACASRQNIPIWLPAAKSSDEVDAGVTIESFGDRYNFRLGEGIGDMAAKTQIPAP